jgi:hypothetical protein
LGKGASNELGVERSIRRRIATATPCARARGPTVEAATYDDCRATLGFQIERGHVDNVDVSGRIVVLAVVAPKQMVEGNWRAGLVFDNRRDR